jgi:uncharacterized protein DUF2510
VVCATISSARAGDLTSSRERYYVNPPEPGWYRDPYFKNRERYWDGEVWTDECRLIQPALGSGARGGAAAAGTGAAGRHEREVRPDPVTAQQPAVTDDPSTTEQPATPTPSDTQPIRIFSGGVAGAGAVGILGGDVPTAGGSTPDGKTAAGDAPDTTSAPPTKAEAAASAERVRTIGAAALLGGDVAAGAATTDGGPPPTRSVKTPKEPPPEATRRVTQDADPLLGVSMPGTNSATTTTGTTTPVAPEDQASKSHRRGVIVAVAAVVVVLAGLGIYLGLNHSSKGGGKNTNKNATAAAASTTVHQKTAHVAISTMLSSALGQIAGPSAVGDFNLSKNEGSMNVTVPGSPAPVPLVFQKKTIYVNLGSSLSAVLPGKTWVSASILQISSSSAGVGTSLSGFEQEVGNPLGLLRRLKASGSTIVSLGPSTFDGTAVQGYTVTLSGKALTKSADLVPASHSTETVYIAKSGGQIKAIVIPNTVSSGGQLVHQNTDIVFSNFGAPVTVTVPPANETVTLAQYQAALGKPSTTAPTAPPPGSPTGATSPGLG